MKTELREHQTLALNLLKRSLGTGHRRPVLMMPTGGGKTRLAAEIVQGALRKSKRVIFVVPAISLIDQTVRAFWREGVRDVGVIQSNHPMTNYAFPVQVASIQTLQNRSVPHADVVIIDECHRVFKFLETWMAEWDAIPFIGLSATPWTRGLGKLYDDLLIAATTDSLIGQGYLSPFRVFAPSSPDLSGVRTVAGDYHEGDLADVMNKPPLVADAVSTWLKLGENRPTLCFGVDRAHAKSLQADFLSAGVPAEYIDAFTENEDREAIFKRFQAGEVRVICNVGCLTTGVDLDVRCIVLCRPTKSEMLFVQIVGRGLRTAPGKDDCLILDHSDTHSRLGFVTDIHHEKLCDGKIKKTVNQERPEPLPKPCGSCKFMKPAKVHKCPSCGFAPEKQSDVEVAAGELLEFKAKKKTNRNDSPEQKEKFFGELKFYAAEKGLKPGWAAHKYKAKYGVFPNAYDDARAVPVSPETLTFISSQNIRWAKSKARNIAGVKSLMEAVR